MPGAGSLNRRVTFKRRVTNRDGYGAPSGATTTLFEVWGRLRETSGRERVLGGALQAPMTGIVTVRSSSATRALTEADWAVIGGVAWNIRGIRNPDERNRFIELDVERGVAPK